MVYGGRLTSFFQVLLPLSAVDMANSAPVPPIVLLQFGPHPSFSPLPTFDPQCLVAQVRISFFKLRSLSPPAPPTQQKNHN